MPARRLLLRLLLATVLLGALAACGAASQREPRPGAGPAGAGPCGTAVMVPARYEHVVWIWMENKSFNEVLRSSNAPYEADLARRCATATSYADVGRPSLPNYIGATSGGTQGVGDDSPPSRHVLTADNLFRQVRAAGMTERSYQESMPSNCALESAGRYAVKHNPAAYYASAEDRAACEADDVPLGSREAGALAGDLDRGSLPAFSFVTPNLCNDTHDCAVRTGDDWLAKWVPRILASSAYAGGKTALFVVWDEATPMPVIAVAPAVTPGTVVGERIDHYSLLRTTEELLGITPYLGKAAAAASMRPKFGL